MNQVFVDSSAIIAYFYGKDENHPQAKESIIKMKEQNKRMVITDYIFDECITGIMSNAGHMQASMAGDFILGSNIIYIVWLDEETKLKAWEYFKRHDDKGYSFTDCTSFVIMKEMRISNYISFDDHFKRAGLVKFL